MNNSRRTRFLAIFLLLASQAFANNSKISPDLLPLLSNSSSQINVIVQYNSQPQAPSGGLLGGLLGGVVGTVVNLLGGVLNVVFSLIPAVSATLHPSDILSVSNQSNVAYISLDRPLGASLDYSAAAVSAPSAWSYGLDGSGVGVAVIDSGIYNHPDLNAAKSSKSRIVYRQSFIGGVLNDDFGHGTHVAGIVAGNGSSSDQQGAFRTFKGIAPNANILDLRVLDQNGASSDSVVIAAIQKAVQLKNQYNVRVINLSVGRPMFESCTQDPLCQAVEAAWKSGIVVVVAAGNEGRNGYGTVLSPGAAPHAITVGAMKTEDTMSTSDDRIASYSSRGPTNYRPDSEARRGGSRQSGGLSARARFHTGERISRKRSSGFRLYKRSSFGHAALFHIERNQHGYPGGFGRRCVDDPERALPYSGRGESAPDEDRFEDLSGDEHGHRSDHRTDLHRLLRHVHGGRRIRGHRRRADELRSGVRIGSVAASPIQPAARHGSVAAESVGDLVDLAVLVHDRSVGTVRARPRPSRNNGHLEQQWLLGQ